MNGFQLIRQPLFYTLTSLVLATTPVSAQTPGAWIIESNNKGSWTFGGNDRNTWTPIKTHQDGITTLIRRVDCFGLNPNCKMERLRENARSDRLSDLEVDCNSWRSRWRPLDNVDLANAERQTIMNSHGGWLGPWKAISPYSTEAVIAERVCPR